MGVVKTSGDKSPRIDLSLENELFCGIIYPVCENMLFLPGEYVVDSGSSVVSTQVLPCNAKGFFF
jgi:hypothetical protein